MADGNELTARENEVLALAWQCMESDPKIDFVKLGRLGGYTPGSANVTFGKIKRKLKAKAAGAPAVPSTPKKATGGRPKTPKSNKRGATEEPATADTPSKKSKKAKKVTKPQSDDEEEFVNFSVKKEEISDINSGADAFFKEATEYAGFNEGRV